MGPVFTALLIEKCNENEAFVKDCDIVLAATKAYREKEDFYSILQRKCSKS